MEKHIGVKLIEAEPTTLGEYNLFRGWTIPANEDPAREGYKVVYPDGYVSWSPKEIFEEAYRRLDNLTFGLAVEALKKGFKVARKGWNGKGMWIVLMPSLSLPPFSSQNAGAKVNDRTAKHIGKDTPLESQPYMSLWNARQQWQPGWNASQEDMLAEDWKIVD